MLTWLDQYVDRHFRNYLELRVPGSRMPKFDNALDLMRFQTNLTLQFNPNEYENLANEFIGRDLSLKYATSNYYQALMAAPILFNRNPLCIQPTVQLTEDFYGAKAPESSEWRELVFSHGIVYLDFPPGILALNSGYYVRSVFLLPTEDGRILSLACIPAPGRFNLDYQIEVFFDFNHEIPADNDPWIVTHNSDTGQDTSLGVTQGQLQEIIRNISKLTLLYYKTQPDSSAITHLPQIKEDAFRALASDKKRRNKLHSMSLFSVIQLNSPRGRFGRNPDKMPEGGWKLDKLVEVRGHFRWQPHGPENQLRKLVWIESYVKGPRDALLDDSEPKPKLVRLK